MTRLIVTAFIVTALGASVACGRLHCLGNVRNPMGGYLCEEPK